MPRRPNVLIFMTDQQQGQVTEPGHPCIKPNLDRFSAQGVRFTNTWTPYALCCPARATFLSGLYPSRHGVFENVNLASAQTTGPLPGTVMFSQRLRDVGYHLTYAGRWHVSRDENPRDFGWHDELCVQPPGQLHQGADLTHYQPSHEPDQPPGHRQRGCVLRPGWGTYRVYDTLPGTDEKVYERQNDWRQVSAAIEKLPELAAGDDPWCMFIGINAPHDNFKVPKRYVDMYDPARVPLPPNYHDDLRDKPGIYRRARRQWWSQLSEDEVRESIAHYWAYCTMVDDMFGRVLEALDATGQADDTLVLFVSDHGEYCGAHGLYLKGVPAFREAYHVPAIVRWPNGIAHPGRAVDAFVSLADFAPTFTELAGVQADPAQFTGRSLAPWLQHQPPAGWRDAIFTQYNGGGLYYSQRTVRTSDFYYVYNGFDEDELYDLRTDPNEMRNVALNPAYESIKCDMIRRMWRFASEQKDPSIFVPYPTFALAPLGPGSVFPPA